MDFDALAVTCNTAYTCRCVTLSLTAILAAVLVALLIHYYSAPSFRPKSLLSPLTIHSRNFMGALCCRPQPIDFDGEINLFHFALLRCVGKGAFGKVCSSLIPRFLANDLSSG